MGPPTFVDYALVRLRLISGLFSLRLELYALCFSPQACNFLKFAPVGFLPEKLVSVFFFAFSFGLFFNVNILQSVPRCCSDFHGIWSEETVFLPHPYPLSRQPIEVPWSGWRRVFAGPDFFSDPPHEAVGGPVPHAPFFCALRNPHVFFFPERDPILDAPLPISTAF